LDASSQTKDSGEAPVEFGAKIVAIAPPGIGTGLRGGPSIGTTNLCAD
jgi:hypothetical protein